MTLGEIRRQAILIVMRQGSEEPSSLEVDSLVNRGLLEFVDRTDYLHDTALLDCVSSQSVYNLPVAALRVVRVALGEKVLDLLSWRDLDATRPLWRNETGTPQGFMADLYGPSQIRLFPIPLVSGASLQSAAFTFSQETGSLVAITGATATFNQETGVLRSLSGYGVNDVTGTLRIDFIKYPTTLAADIDVPDLPRQYHDCLAAYAAAHLLTRNGDPERAANFLAEFENQVTKARRESSKAFQRSLERTVRTESF